MINKNIIGVRISKLLNGRGLTQKQFAEALGVTEVSISRYLHGDRTPSYSRLISIARFFNVPVPYLIDPKCDDCLLTLPPHGELIDRDLVVNRLIQMADNIEKRFGYEKSAPIIMIAMFIENSNEFPTVIESNNAATRSANQESGKGN